MTPTANYETGYTDTNQTYVRPTPPCAEIQESVYAQYLERQRAHLQNASYPFPRNLSQRLLDVAGGASSQLPQQQMEVTDRQEAVTWDPLECFCLTVAAVEFSLGGAVLLMDGFDALGAALLAFGALSAGFAILRAYFAWQANKTLNAGSEQIVRRSKV